MSAEKLATRVELSQNRRRLIGRLRRRRMREREGAVLVEGRRAVREALDAGAEPLFAVLSDGLDSGDDGRALSGRLRGLCDVARVDDAELRELADTDHPQGVLLVCREPAQDRELFRARDRVLVLDALQDPGNLGTLVRSAVAFGLHGVLCLDGTADAWGAKAVRASAGTVFRIPVRRSSASSAADVFRDRHVRVRIAATDGRPAREAFASASPSDEAPSALVVGNEGAGVRPDVRALAHESVAVPMAGPAESLNAGVAGSILMYEWTR